MHNPGQYSLQIDIRALYRRLTAVAVHAKRVFVVVLVSGFTAAGLLYSADGRAEPRVIETYDSPYNHVIVLQESDVISLKRMENGAIVSAVDRANPARQVVPYTGYLFAPALFHPAPRRVLNIGLGAGAINRLFTRLYPDALLVSIEIDPMIVEIAIEHTGFAESENDRIVIQDGRVFLRQEKRKWDWIIIDAFVKHSQIPSHLTTLEFFRLVSDRLTKRGVMAINLHSGSRLFDSQTATLRKAFAQVLFFRVHGEGNVIALAVDFPEPSLLTLMQGLDPSTLPDARAYAVDLVQIQASILPADNARLKQPAEILIDDFAPVEFLDLLESDSAP